MLNHPQDNARNATRAVRVGTVTIGGGRPIVLQSMCATKTSDVEATLRQIRQLAEAGAGVVRVAVDSRRDVEALEQIRPQTDANLSIDLQENYRLGLSAAPLVEKMRYNPGHLFHHEPERPWQDKVRMLVDAAGEHDCALRVGVNCGSVDPRTRERFDPHDSIGPMLSSALEHCDLLDRLGFTRFCVSLKDSDPAKVVEVNRRFAAERPEVPLHLGVTEAGMPPEGVEKTRSALGQLVPQGIGDTIRVSLTVPASQKHLEIEVARQILDELAAGHIPAPPAASREGLEIISCPSCSRVENEAFVELAQRVREATRHAAKHRISIAVMGCRVNGPGETDDADLGLWCGPKFVNLKRGGTPVGSFSYDEIIPRLLAELDTLLAQGR